MGHTALTAEYLIEHIARIPVDVQYASEFRYREPIIRTGDVLIVISSSGETSDAVESMRLVKRLSNVGDILTLAVVNEADSTLARETDAHLVAEAGTEQGVA